MGESGDDIVVFGVMNTALEYVSFGYDDFLRAQQIARQLKQKDGEPRAVIKLRYIPVSEELEWEPFGDGNWPPRG
jgi:hypothetical protein